jgi:hypothetical protein
MKKWIYLIIPAILMVGFLFIYFGHVETMHQKETAKAASIAQEKASAEAKKKDAEDKARSDAKKRQEERDAEEARKEKEKSDKQAADDKKVRDAVAEFTAKANAASKQATSLEQELDRIRKEKDRLSRETFDFAKEVELARIARRNAELEIQRMTEMIARRAGESSMTRPPVIAAPAPAKS